MEKESAALVEKKWKVAVLYICTGDYELFWRDFFISFEENFLKQSEVHYFVFTDKDKIYGEEECERIHRRDVYAMPWPLITLLRFHIFLSAEEELEYFEYLYFLNSNMRCKRPVSEEEFLPRKEMGEELVAAQHPGYFKTKVKDFPYERRKISTAYVPYNQGEVYVMGGLIGGNSNAFLNMSKQLKQRINEDLSKGVIATWHDESQLNRYIIGKKNWRLLSAAYGYPDGWDIPYEKVIIIASKNDYFDVNEFKGIETKKEFNNLPKHILKAIWMRIKRIVPFSTIYLMRDTLLRKRIS